MTVQVLDFNTPADYTYDANEIEVANGFAQKKKIIYLNELIYADFSSDTFARRSVGPSSSAIIGNGSVASGVVDLTGGTLNYVQYNGANVSTLENTGCIRVDMIPNYTGAPSATVALFSVTSPIGINNIFQVSHSAVSGNFFMQFFDTTGGSIFQVSPAQWFPVAGVSYNIEINFDVTVGETRLFIDGVQQGSTITSTGTRVGVADFLSLGTDQGQAFKTDAKFDNFQVFNSVQHTVNFTPETSYGDYNINSKSIINNTSIETSNVKGVYSCAINGTGTSAKYVLNIDTIDKYFDGLDWVNSTSPSESNTEDEINTNIASLDLSAGIDFLLKSYLESTDGNDTPKIDKIIIDYDTLAAQPGGIGECEIRADLKDSQGNPVVGARVIFIPNAFWYSETYIFEETEAVTDQNGSILVSVVETESNSATMNIKIVHENGLVILYKNKVIPNKVSESLSVIIAS